MKKRIIAIISMILAFSTLFCFTVSAKEKVEWISYDDYKQIEDYAYSFAVVGDTQIITCYDWLNEGTANPTNYVETLYQWIIDNKESKKIAYVMGLGDITDADNATEWRIASKQITRLDGVVPYSLVRGNHDSVGMFTSIFKNYTPYTSTLEGYYEGDNKVLNNYRTITICGIKYLIMVLDYYPTNGELEWANQVVEEHPDHRIIVTTHSHLSSDGYMWSYNDSEEPKDANNGLQVWSKFVKKHKNIFMVLSGHISAETIVVDQRRGANGNIVTQILVDGQDMDKVKPRGLIMMLYFSNDGSKISIEWYSPINNEYKNINRTEVKITPYGTEHLYTTAATSSETEQVVSSLPITEKAEDKGCKGEVIFAILPISVSSALAVVSSKKRRKHNT